MNLYNIYHSKIDRSMTLYIFLLDQLSPTFLCHFLSLCCPVLHRCLNTVHTWWSIKEKKRRKWIRHETPMKRIITSFGDFSLSLPLSSRIQIICVWMTRVLHHLVNKKMCSAAPVNISRMNEQLDVTGAHRHIHIYIYQNIYMYDEWWRVRCRRKFSNRTPTRDDNKKDDFSKWEKEWNAQIKLDDERDEKFFFWFMSHHYDSEAINQTQQASKH